MTMMRMITMQPYMEVSVEHKDKQEAMSEKVEEDDKDSDSMTNTGSRYQSCIRQLHASTIIQ
jgi:hypothetical protein